MSADRVRATAFDLGSKETRPFDLARLDDELAKPSVFVWIDIEGPKVESFDALLRRFKVDPSPAGDFERPEILPRIIERDDYVSFDLYEVEDPSLHLDTAGGIKEIEVQRLVVVLGERFVATFHRGPMGLIRYVDRDAGRNFQRWGKTPGFLAFLFLERCLYDYAHLNLANDNYLDQMEDEVLGGDMGKLAEDVSTAGQNILTLKKLAASLQIVLMNLATKRSIFVSDEAREFYHEMLRNAIAVRATIDSSRTLLDAILNAVQSQATHKTNEVAKILTVVSTIVLPLSLITGIYGMNFRHIPELEVEWGYHALLGIMAAIGGVFVIVFKRLGWLDAEVGLRRGRRKKAAAAAVPPAP